MLKNLLVNKKLLAVIVAVIVIIAGIVIAVVINQDSKETGKLGISIDTEKNKDNAQENDADKDEAYSGTGLEIMDEVDTTVDSVDGSGDWDDDSDGNQQEEKNNNTDSNESDDTKKDNNSDQNDNVNDESDEDILVDDKEWGEIS